MKSASSSPGSLEGTNDTVLYFFVLTISYQVFEIYEEGHASLVCFSTVEVSGAN